MIPLSPGRIANGYRPPIPQVFHGSVIHHVVHFHRVPLQAGNQIFTRLALVPPSSSATAPVESRTVFFAIWTNSLLEDWVVMKRVDRSGQVFSAQRGVGNSNYFVPLGTKLGYSYVSTAGSASPFLHAGEVRVRKPIAGFSRLHSFEGKGERLEKS